MKFDEAIAETFIKKYNILYMIKICYEGEHSGVYE